MRSPSYVGKLSLIMMTALGLSFGCSADFDTERSIPKRGTLGQELYGLLCDRVGAQALREDITGTSFRSLCHPNAQGKFGTKVNTAALTPLTKNAVDINDKPVSVETQIANRKYRVGRIEALAAHREELIKAFDAALPDIEIALGNREKDKSGNCGSSELAKGRMLKEFAETLSRFIDLYNDNTIPYLTRSLGNMMTDIEQDKEVQAALARIDARDGYRPSQIALGVARPALAYPRLFELANVVLRLVAEDSDPENPANIDKNGKRTPVPGKANLEFQHLLRVAREELRAPLTTPPLESLKIAEDSSIPGRLVLSRPRANLEIAKDLLLSEHESFGNGDIHYLTKRDNRGVAVVPIQGGELPFPFVANEQGLPKLNELGQFLTTDDSAPPSPFVTPFGSEDKNRDSFGRVPVYSYIDVSHSFMASLLKDIRPLFTADPTSDQDTFMKVLAGIPVLSGKRDDSDDSSKTYPAITTAKDGSKTETKGTTLNYKGFRATESPLVDLTYAIGQLLTRPELEDALVLIRQLVKDHPQELARMVGIGFQLKAIADKHPEASIPENSTFWDEMLDVAIKIVQAPGVVEDLIKAFGDKRTVQLDKVFASYFKYRDVLTYQKDAATPDDLIKFNGAPFNLTTQTVSEAHTLVDRSKADTGDNRSQLQKFIQLLHDANGLSVCTKQGAVAHLEVSTELLSNPFLKSLGVKINVDYPPGDDAVSKLAIPLICTLVGADNPPDPMPQCGILAFDNVAKIIVDVALQRAKFDIYDDCLNKLLANDSITGLVGGAGNFLQYVSGIDGFTLEPTVPAIARLAYFDTPYNMPYGSYAGDQFYPKTRDFLKDIIDPIPSMTCPETPFTDKNGKTFPLRTCTSFKDTLRGRDANSLFPLGQLGFVESITPLAAAFADHDQPLLFVELFDTMHLHWGSPKQSKDECDPSLPRSNFRWCSHDGAVSYEPLLGEMLETDLFPTLFELVGVLQKMTVPHCTFVDPETQQCTATTPKNGVDVLADAVRVMVDPKPWKGLRDRYGRDYSVRNDGKPNSHLTPVNMLIDSLKGMDAAFATYSQEHEDGDQRLQGWRSARSTLVDTFFAVDGEQSSAQFRNPAIINLLPSLIDLLRSQIDAHCPGRYKGGVGCEWAEGQLADNLSEVLSGPTYAGMIDLLEIIRTDPEASSEVQRLIIYLLDEASDNDAQATTLAAAADVLQTLVDDSNMQPIYRVVANGLSETQIDKDTKEIQRGLVSSMLEVLTRIFARPYSSKGEQLCGSAVDPNQTIALLLQRLVTPAKPGEATPIETIFHVIAEVNRKEPGSNSKLTGDDYGNITKEIGDFCLNKSTGLEQVYEVIRQATSQ
jgi:hypothetical protein